MVARTSAHSQAQLSGAVMSDHGSFMLSRGVATIEAISGLSRGVLWVLQHPPLQLNNSSQNRKQVTLLFTLIQQKQQSGNGWGLSCACEEGEEPPPPPRMHAQQGVTVLSGL